MRESAWISFPAIVFVFVLCVACYSQVDPQSDSTAENSDQLIRRILQPVRDLSAFNRISLLLGLALVLLLTFTINRTLKKAISALGTKVKSGLAEGIKEAMETAYQGFEPQLSHLVSQASTTAREFSTLPGRLGETLGEIRKVYGGRDAGDTRQVVGFPLMPSRPELRSQIEEIDDLLYDQKFPEAERKLQELRGECPDHEDVLILSAKYHAAIRNWNTSEELLDQGENMNPNNPEVYFVRGQNRSALGKYREAETLYRRAIGLNSKDSRYFLALGYSLWRRNQIDEAIEQTEQASRLSAGDPRTKLLAANNLAYYYALKHRIKYLDKALPLADSLPQLLKAVKKRRVKGDQQYQTRAHVYLCVYELKEKDEKWLKKSIHDSLSALDINPANAYAQASLAKASKLLISHEKLP